jgi:hypothetical protein
MLYPFKAMKTENGHTEEPSRQSKVSVTMPDLPLPTVSDLDPGKYESKVTLIEDIIESLRRSGGCVVRNMVAKDRLDEIEKEVRPYLNIAEPWNGMTIKYSMGPMSDFELQVISGHQRPGR